MIPNRRCCAAVVLAVIASFAPATAVQIGVPAAAVSGAVPAVIPATGRAQVVARDTVRFADAARGAPVGPASQARAPQPIPGDLPVPPSAVPSHPVTAASGVQQEQANPPTVESSFAGVADNGTVIPPDTHGAVGPSHVMTVTNQDVLIQARDGTAAATAGLDAWWAGLGTPDAFDPKAFYDPFGARFIFVALADPTSASSALLIGVSTTTDPTGTWHRYRMSAESQNTNWADYPSVGFTKDWITIQVNMFTIASTPVFSYSRMFFADKADMYVNGDNPIPYGDLYGLGGTQVPAVTYAAGEATQYLLQNWNGNSGGQGSLRLYSVTGTVGAPMLTVGPFITSLSTWGFQAPSGVDFAPQSGSTQKIQTGDARLQNVVYRNGALFAAQTVFLPAATPTRASVQWWEVTTAGAATQMGRVDDATGATFHAFPSIAVNALGDALVGFSRFSGSSYARAAYAFRYGVDPPNTLAPAVTMKAGEAAYYKTGAGTRNRWGDYSGAQVDPLNDTDLWTVQEYAAAPSGGQDRWGTWWARLRPNPAPALSASPSAVDFGNQTTGTVSAQRSIIVTSIGQRPAVIGAVSLAGANAGDFTIPGNSCSGRTLSPGGSCTLGVRFGPTADGARAAALSIASDAPDAPDVVPLSGTGVPPGPELSVMPASLSFGNQEVGASSTPKRLTVSNAGVGTLIVDSVGTGGADAAHFTIAATTCPTTPMSSGGTCTIDVSFAPQTTGTKSGSVTITSNAARSPSLVPVTGYGIPAGGLPGFSFSPASLGFGARVVGSTSAPATMLVRNTGTAPLVIAVAEVVGTHLTDFEITLDLCGGTTVAPGGSCTIRLTFTPGGVGQRLASLSMTSNAPGGRNTAGLNGSGLDAGPPQSAFTTPDGELRLGVSGVGALSSMTVVNGVTFDALTRIAAVEVTFQSATGSVTRALARLACDTPGTTCTWSATVPLIPGVYTATAQATDASANKEDPGPSIRIFVV